MRLSVIIPAHNRAGLLRATLRSLLVQTVQADEILVVDDGSTDGTAEVAASFGDPVRVIRQANAGPAAARNRGFSESRGEYIHFFDSDDLALANKHEVQLKALDQTGADIAYGPWVKGKISNSGFLAEDQVLQQSGLPAGDLVKALLCQWSIVPHACLFRRSIIERAGGFPEELFVAEDQLLFLRCLLADAKVVHSPGTLELYRTNDATKLTASSAAAKARHHRDWARFLVMARNECLAPGTDPAQWFGFRARAWQALEGLGDDGDPQVAESLGQIVSQGNSRLVYLLHRFATQKFSGLKARLAGTRANASFCTGKITPEQQALIEKIDFQAH